MKQSARILSIEELEKRYSANMANTNMAKLTNEAISLGYSIALVEQDGLDSFDLYDRLESVQFALEILIVSDVMLGIGAVCGSFLAKPVGNMLLENEIQSVQEETEQISNNFGKGGPMDMNFGGTVNVQTIDTINAVVDITVVAQLLGIGLALMLVSSLASMISIQRFSPLTILKERS